MVAERIRKFEVSAYADGALSVREDAVVAEEPLEIRLGKEPLAVVMRSPAEVHSWLSSAAWAGFGRTASRPMRGSVQNFIRRALSSTQ